MLEYSFGKLCISVCLKVALYGNWSLMKCTTTTNCSVIWYCDVILDVRLLYSWNILCLMRIIYILNVTSGSLSDIFSFYNFAEICSTDACSALRWMPTCSLRSSFSVRTQAMTASEWIRVQTVIRSNPIKIVLYWPARTGLEIPRPLGFPSQ